jgi:hypothetical protein
MVEIETHPTDPVGTLNLSEGQHLHDSVVQIPVSVHGAFSACDSSRSDGGNNSTGCPSN